MQIRPIQLELTPYEAIEDPFDVLDSQMTSPSESRLVFEDEQVERLGEGEGDLYLPD